MSRSCSRCCTGSSTRGNTVIVIEHNLDVIKTADWIIDLGPEGGARGGEVVVAGTPEKVAATTGSATGEYLARVLRGEPIIPLSERLVRRGSRLGVQWQEARGRSAARSRAHRHRRSLTRPLCGVDAGVTLRDSDVRACAIRRLRRAFGVKRSLKWTAVCSAVVLATLMIGSAVASAAGVLRYLTAKYKPDGSTMMVKSRYLFWDGWFTYKGYDDHWHGVGVYNESGDHQIAVADTQQVGIEKHTVSISIKNAGSKPVSIQRFGTYGGFTGDWSVKWFKGTTDVTNKVKNGTYLSPVVEPGHALTLTLKLNGDASLGYLGSITTTATSAGDANKIDAVKVDLEQAIWCYC